MAPIRPHLTGNRGRLIRRSPDSRYEIRLAIMANFPCEAIVNATNYPMVLNTSARRGAEFRIVDGAGNKLSQFLYHLRPRGLHIGDAVTSPSFNLTNCYHIIHTNGPDYKDRIYGSRALRKQQLADCYRRCLEEAFENKAHGIAFPCISTGPSLKWPRESAARIGVMTVRAWFRHPIYGEKRRERIKRVYFLADPLGLNSRQERAWIAAFNEFWPPAEQSSQSGSPPPEPVWFRSSPRLPQSGDIRVTSDQVLERDDEPPLPRQGRIISQKELKNVTDSTLNGNEPAAGKRSGRLRRPPKRYGQDD